MDLNIDQSVRNVFVTDGASIKVQKRLFCLYHIQCIITMGKINQYPTHTEDHMYVFLRLCWKESGPTLVPEGY